MDKEQARQKISELVNEYEKVAKLKKAKSYSEEDTIKGFILPLFHALGWDVYEKDEVSAEDHIKGAGYADYNFKINGITQFFLEAKKLSADLDDEKFAFQVINYSWNKGVTWAVLSDFEGVKVFNAQRIDKADLIDKMVFDIPYSKYIEDFETLWLISKQACSEKRLDAFAEKHGKKEKSVSVANVTKKLNEDIQWARARLTESFEVCNTDTPISKDLLDEGVQKLLDRLLFLRVAEDRGVEPNILKNLKREAEQSQSKNEYTPFQVMVSKFRELNTVYDSNLFSEHTFESWLMWDGALGEVIDRLYGKKGYYEYNFKEMPADVLGTVYESYLGYKLSTAQSKDKNLFGKSEEKTIVSKDAKKRKEQGIYYTPPFVVDYIVRNALKPVLDNCKTIGDLKKIKVLDPACGSGSFLIKALEAIAEKYREFGSNKQYVKRIIILENLYGVDLDPQAVEIARLNLLINSLNERERLPFLDKNIKNGNSLISGTDKELEKQFGKSWQDKKPFNWEEEFPDVFKQGGFDVVIGNPPWGANIDADVEYYAAAYPNSTKNHKDIYKIFLDKGISLLRDGGSLGFIVPNTFLYQPRYEDAKEFVNKNENFVVNLGERIFQNVELPSCILILEKKPGTNKFVADLTKENRDTLGEAISAVNSSSVQKINAGAKGIVKDTGVTFDNVFLLKDAGIQYASTGAGKARKGESDLPERIFSETQDDIFDTPFYTGSNISRDKWFIEKEVTKYFRSSYKDIVKSGEWVHFTKDVFDAPQKIVWRQTSDCIKAAIMNFQAYFGKTIHAALIKDEYKNKIDIHYALAIFNSKYLDYLYHQKVMETGKVFPQVKLGYLRDMPFVIAPKEKQKTVSDLAKKMIAFNTELRETPEHSEKWERIRSDIAKTNRKIDEEVYKLYGLTEEETKIVEGNTQ